MGIAVILNIAFNLPDMQIHFIGICGVAMSALAIAFENAGHTVSGSDAGFYPPVSHNLKKTNIRFYPGWHPDKMCANGAPDLVVVGNVASSTNPEWVYVQENKLEYVSYPEAIAKFFLKDNVIVAAGTYGKTTTSTLLSWIFRECREDPSYMFGGLALNDMDAAHLGKGNWTILEGDEYKSSRWDNGAKFTHYKPTHLLLTAVEWDHMDVYATEIDYINAFQGLVDEVKGRNGTLVVSERVRNVLNMPEGVIWYGPSAEATYQYTNVQTTKEGTSCIVTVNGQSYEINTQMLGAPAADNATACFAMAVEAGLEPSNVIEAIASFKGLKRRLEKRLDGPVTVIDDIAHSPAKALSTLSTLRELYSGKLIAVFEPNTGNRKQSSVPSYNGAFAPADEVIIPRLSKVKRAPNDPDVPMNGQELAEVIATSHKNVQYIEDDQELVKRITHARKDGDVIAFLGSHGFRGMIEETINQLKNEV